MSLRHHFAPRRTVLGRWGYALIGLSQVLLGISSVNEGRAWWAAGNFAVVAVSLAYLVASVFPESRQ